MARKRKNGSMIYAASRIPKLPYKIDAETSVFTPIKNIYNWTKGKLISIYDWLNLCLDSIDSRYIYYLLICSIGILAAIAFSMALLPKHYYTHLEMPIIQMTNEDISNKLTNPVVAVRTNYGAGSGVIIGKHFILSAAHIIEKPKFFFEYEDEENEEIENLVYVLIRYNEFSAEVWMPVTVSRVNEKLDLLLLHVQCELPYDGVALTYNDITRIGDKLLIIGWPSGSNGPNCQDSYLSAKYCPMIKDAPELWQCSSAANPGNSGGPVFLKRTGQLIGIMVRIPYVPGHGWSSNVSYFVPWHHIAQFLGIRS
jgi:S1-C subfamily serine protease